MACSQALIEFPDDVKRATFHATYTVRTLERAASYGLPLVAVMCVVFLAHRALRHRQQHRQQSRQPVQIVRVS